MFSESSCSHAIRPRTVHLHEGPLGNCRRTKLFPSPKKLNPGECQREDAEVWHARTVCNRPGSNRWPQKRVGKSVNYKCLESDASHQTDMRSGGGRVPRVALGSMED